MNTEQRARELLAEVYGFEPGDEVSKDMAIRAIVRALSPPASAGEEFVVVAVPPANCRQRLSHEGKPYPRMSCAVCGKFSPNWRQCDAVLHGIAAAAPTPPAAEDGRDTKRLDWLEANRADVFRTMSSDEFAVQVCDDLDVKVAAYKPTLRAAIDAAMLTSPDSGKEG
jgi:hypothetical protein